MHQVKFIKIFLLLWFSACSSAGENPRNLIPESKMVQVMVNAHVFEAMAEARSLQGDSLARFIKTNYLHIFEKNGISEEQFLHTFGYYEQHPSKMDELMTKVIDELSKMEAGIQ